MLLEMRDIRKTFPGVVALNKVNLRVKAGEIHAIVGENGAGKSTLMKVLSGVYPHGSYSGDIHFDGQERRFDGIRDSEHLGVIIIHQELALVPLLSIAENIFLGNETSRYGVIDWMQAHSKALALLQKAGLRPLTTNAWGMLYGASMLALYCALSGIPFTMEWNARYIGSLLYLVIPGSVIGFTAYLTLVGRMGPERAAYCTVLFPLVALNVSAFAEGYQWTAPALMGLILVMLGNVLVFRKPKPVLMSAKLA